MKITTLGTSHGDPTKTRYQTSTLLETQGRYYLIDAGEPANAFLVQRNLSASQLSAIFITHMHIDHTGSLPVLIEQSLKYRHLQPDTTLSVQLPEQEAIAPLRAWLSSNCGKITENNPPIYSYRENNGYDDGFLRMTPIPTRHLQPASDGKPRSFALQVETEGKRILFSGDLSSDYSDFPVAAAENCDAVFTELTHSSIEKIVPFLENIHIGRLIFCHVGNRYQTPEGERKVREYSAALPYPFEIAEDGFELNIP